MAIEMAFTVNTLVLFFFSSFIGSILCAPSVSEETVYDQRQNGTENIRVHIKGVVIVHAPLEALVALASLPGVSEEASLEQQLTEILSGTSSTTETGLVQPSTEAEVPNSSKPERSTSAAPSAGNTTAPTEGKPVQGQSQTLPKKTSGMGVVYKIYIHGTKATLLTGRAENIVKGAYVITAQTQLETTYTQHPCHCKTNPDTTTTG